MIMSFLRENRIAAIILFFIRLVLGYTWLSSGWDKIIGGSFDASGYLANAIADPVMAPDGTMVYGWYVSFLERIAFPNVELFNIIVPLGEFLIGLGLILGCLTTAAAFFGIIMNFSFFLAGTVSHIPTDLVLGTIILVAGANAGYFGLDQWVIPYIRKNIFKQKSNRKYKIHF